jgi:predicted NAD-dependent protein-ADP-ribosyltransferase YbiA (DUF1768 family)
VAYETARQKFEAAPWAASILSSADEDVLVQGAPRDTMWGCGPSVAAVLASGNEWAANVRNLLPRALMSVRAELRAAATLPSLARAD